MTEILQMAPQMAVAAFIVAAVIFLRREQLRNGGITRDEFNSSIKRIEDKVDDGNNRLEKKIDEMKSEQQAHSTRLARIDERCALINGEGAAARAHLKSLSTSGGAE